MDRRIRLWQPLMRCKCRCMSRFFHRGVHEFEVFKALHIHMLLNTMPCHSFMRLECALPANSCHSLWKLLKRNPEKCDLQSLSNDWSY